MKRFLTLIALLFALPAWSATVVQIDKHSQASNTTHTLAFPGAFTNTNLAAVVFMTSGAITSVETTGDVQTCTQAGTSANIEGTADGYVYICPNASASVTGFSIVLGTSNDMLAVVVEISGYDTSTPFDAIGPKAGTFSVNATRVSVTTNAADSIAVGFAYTSGTSGFTADSGFTELEDETTSVAFYSNTGLGAAGAKVTGGVMSSAVYGYGVVGTFRNATGGGGSPAPRRTLMGVG